MIQSQMTRAQWGLLVLLSILWGGSFFFVEIILTELPPLSLVLCRVAVAALCLWLVLITRGMPVAVAPRIWFAFAIMGLLNNALPFVLIAWGQITISSGTASILNATTPLFAVVVTASMLADEQPTRSKILGAAVGFCGVTILIGTDAIRGLGQDLPAQAAVLGAAISYAFAGAFGRRFRDYGVDPILVAAGQLTASSIFLAPVVLAVDQPHTLAMPGGEVMLSLAGLAVFSTALAYVLYFRLLEQAGATNLLLVTFLIPVSAISLGMIVLNETLQPSELAGMAVIALGLSIVDGRIWRRSGHPSEEC